MAKYPNMTTTQAGLDAIAEANAKRQALIFTKIILGAGEMPASIPRLTALVDKKLEIVITEFDNPGGGVFIVRGALSNESLEEGFYAREVGVLAKVGASGREILFSYTNGGNYVDYIPDKNTVMDSYTFTVNTVVGNAESLSVQKVDGAFVTQKALREHDNDASVHSALMSAHNADKNAHEVITDVIKALKGTRAFDASVSKSVTEIITLLGMGGIVAAKLDANAGFVKFANGFIIQWGNVAIPDGKYYSDFTLPLACDLLLVVTSDIRDDIATSIDSRSLCWNKGASTNTKIRILSNNTNTGSIGYIAVGTNA